MHFLVSIFALATLSLGIVLGSYFPQDCTAGPLKDNEKEQVMDIVNHISQVMAYGQLSGFPGAANLPYVSWDKNLESIAQRQIGSCDIHVSICPNSPNAPYGFMVGQYKSRCPYQVRSTYALTSVLIDWINEHVNLDPKNVYNFQSCTAPNFSQLITGFGYYMGCGRAYDFDGEFYTMKLICAMKTAGNVIGQPMYAVGAPCSQCPQGTKCDKDWPGLCSLTS